jgi:XTP/dITP diphosphohydrolase
MRSTSVLVFASNNSHKLVEMRALLAPHTSLELKSASSALRNADKIGHVEIHNTYLENAAAKARLVNHGCHYPALADDSGLEVMALDGAPGVHSRRYAKIDGSPSAMIQDEANIQKLLKNLEGKEDRRARFVCTLSLVVEGIMISADGFLEGTIATAPRGQMGFGYDPIFVPKGDTRTLGEFSETEKNKISHRARALKALLEKMSAHGIQIAKP